jgi:hypothetical protein
MKLINRIKASAIIVMTVFMVSMYLYALIDKISHPEYKNASYKEYLFIGFIVLVFVLLSVLNLKEFMQHRLQQKLKGKSETEL